MYTYEVFGALSNWELTALATWPWFAVLIFWIVYLEARRVLLELRHREVEDVGRGGRASVFMRTRALPFPLESLITQSATAVCIVPETPRMPALSALGSAGSAGWSAVTTLIPFFVAALSWLATTCHGAASSTIAPTLLAMAWPTHAFHSVGVPVGSEQTTTLAPTAAAAVFSCEAVIWNSGTTLATGYRRLSCP